MKKFIEKTFITLLVGIVVIGTVAIGFNSTQRSDAAYIPPAGKDIPQWIKITKNYTDFAVAATANTITIYTPANNEIVEAVRMYNDVAFNGGLIATYTISVGQTSTANLLVASSVFNVFSFPYAGAAISSPALIAPDAITATAISTVATLNQATNGHVTFWLKVATLP